MTRRTGAGLQQDTRGQALVEFALIVPLLMLLLLGIADMARAWNVYEVLTDAGREATRLAVVDNGSTPAQVRQVVKDAAARAGVTVQDAEIDLVEGAGRGDPTSVTITYAHDLRWVGGLLGLVGAARTLDFTIASTMRRE